MKPFYLTLTFLFLGIFSIEAQHAYSAKIIDSTTQKPIPYATISLNKKTGVISNEYGKFQLYIDKKITSTDSLFIRCMGYNTKQIAVEKFADSIVILNPKSIELDEVLVSNKNYTVDEIIEKVKENLSGNYDFTFTKSKLFYRASHSSKILKNNISIEKTTIPEFNQQFIDSVLMLMPKSSDDYTEILGELYGKTGSSSQKLDIIKASHLYDDNTDVSFDGFEDRFNSIIRKHVKRDSYFKIKSGIFGTKEEMDSSFFVDTEENEAEVEKTKELIEQQKKNEEEQKKNFLNHRKNTIANVGNNSFIFEDTQLNFLEKDNRYEFELIDYIFLNDDFAYKITFIPKRKEDFKGTIYVNTDDFAIVRIDYENVKPLKKFSLLGFSFSNNLKKGTLIYSKNNSEKYALQFADVEMGSKFGVKRPLKIIEKNKHVKGRRKQNEVASKLHFIVTSTEKHELVVFENESIAENIFTEFAEQAKVQPTELKQYDPDFWKGHNIIEPNQAIKNFKSIE